MKRIFFIVSWIITFAVISAVLGWTGVIVSLLVNNNSNTDDPMPWFTGAVVLVFPISMGLLGAVLGLMGKLPGTKSLQGQSFMGVPDESRLARIFLGQREHHCSMGFIYRGMLKIYTFFFCLYGCLFYLMYHYINSKLTYLLAGLLLGILLQNHAWFRTAKKQWPFLSKVINWEKVEAIAQSSTKEGAQLDSNGTVNNNTPDQSI
ncbi:MAG: hypothetical protein ABFD91_13480 [Anaerohalosphaeraceae bacterium]